MEAKEVLGLVSLLKEQKKSKVVLLLNDGEENLQDYEKYREKVIDIELAFAPNPEECASIAYPGESRTNDKLRELTTNLEIRNIRILKKIERLVGLSSSLVQNLEPEVVDQVMHSLVLYAWSYFGASSNEEIPTLEFLTSKGYALLGIGDEKISENEKKWLVTLQAYKYLFSDDFDLLLAEAVKTGYFVEAEFKDKSSAKNQQIVASKSEGAFSDAWQIYFDTFDNNGEEVISALYESFKNNCEYLSPTHLERTVSLFRELGASRRRPKL